MCGYEVVKSDNENVNNSAEWSRVIKLKKMMQHAGVLPLSMWILDDNRLVNRQVGKPKKLLPLRDVFYKFFYFPPNLFFPLRSLLKLQEKQM